VQGRGFCLPLIANRWKIYTKKLLFKISSGTRGFSASELSAAEQCLGAASPWFGDAAGWVRAYHGSVSPGI